MPNFFYYQVKGGEEYWQPLPAPLRDQLTEEKHPMFVTALSVSKLVDDLPHEEKMKLTYEGALYFDWDSTNVELVIEKVNQFLDTLEEKKVNLHMCKIYATGGRGFHVEIPQAMFMKVPKGGTPFLPSIYREIAMALVTDTMDMRVYSSGRGRMWRQPNVQRENEHYKVEISPEEVRLLTPDSYSRITAEPRPPLKHAAPDMNIELSVMFASAQQKVEELMKRRGKFRADPLAKDKVNGPSIEWMMEGHGIKEGVGFQSLSLQLSIVAHTAGWTEQQLVDKCHGLIENHQGDGNRYNTPDKREFELRRMWRYMEGNVCYEFGVGPLKALLTHAAPDLDNIPATKAEVKQVIEEAEAEEDLADVDEYADVARGISLTKYGIYMETAEGKKRVCAVSFTASSVLMSAETSQIVGYETDILVNGRPAGRQTLELEVFSGLVQFNRFVAKYGHSFVGSDAQVRIVMMRFVEQARKKGDIQYIVKREGLDLIRIPHHENPLYHEPFLVWADGHTVTIQPSIAETGLALTFAGYPDPRGTFKTDISQAPALVSWVQEPENRALLKHCLQNLITCQRAELLGKYLGWYTACFWRQLFHATYEKFPLLHVNGAAGAGKTEMTVSIANLFSWKQGPKVTSPGSTLFALQQYTASSSSLPLLIDEYKPHEMALDLRNKMRAMFRDAYNQRDTSRGGGTRESDDYRVLHTQQLSAPLVFIAEATEDEAAVMERVVLATVVRPGPQQALNFLHRFQEFRKSKHLLGILGQYLAAQVVNETTVEGFRAEFDALYEVAQRRFMVTEEDLKGGIDPELLKEKQNAKERSVYNHTVALYGFKKFRELVNKVLDNELDAQMGELEEGIYARMSDLAATTTPEVIRVLEAISSMSHSVERERAEAIAPNKEYAFDDGQQFLELDVRTAYMKYRMYMKNSNMQPLLASWETFSHALADQPAFVKRGVGIYLPRPGVLTLRNEELLRNGIIFATK